MLKKNKSDQFRRNAVTTYRVTFQQPLKPELLPYINTGINNFIESYEVGTFLVVQWLRLWL